MKPSSPLSRLLIAGIVGLGALAAGCGGSHDEQARPTARPIDVRTIVVTASNLPTSFEAGGVVQARASATLTSRIVALVQEVRVKAGDRVRAGQVLVRLDDRDLAANARRAQASISAAEHAVAAARSERDGAAAALALAEATHRRVSQLQERKSATAQELDQATASLRGAQAGIATIEARTTEAESALASARAAGDAARVVASYAVVTAPFDGIVTEKLIDPGNMASPGTPLVRLDGGGGFRVDVRLDEGRAQFLAPDDPVDVVFDAVGAPGQQTVMKGSVAEIARAVDSDSRAFLVKVTIDAAPYLRSGMFARVRVKGPSRSGLSVPTSAVIKRGQVATVFVAEGDVARLRLAQTGAQTAEQVEIVAGLDTGDRVIVSPPPGLTDGQRVRVVTSEQGARR